MLSQVCVQYKMSTYPIMLQYGEQQMIILHVRETDSIFDLLSEIVSKTDLDIANDTAVVYDSVDLTEVERHSTLANNNIWEGSLLTATVRATNTASMLLYIKNLHGETFSFRCAPNW
jgi:hypothetical protein